LIPTKRKCDAVINRLALVIGKEEELTSAIEIAL
jgi:hypothetical protein